MTNIPSRRIYFLNERQTEKTKIEEKNKKKNKYEMLYINDLI